jgi:PTS system nitrogen regulatory IIA component
MQISDILTPNRIAHDVRLGSKKRVLELLGKLAVQDEPDLNSTEVFESLIARERLGSTGIGEGVAIPHGRLKNSPRAIGALVRLEVGINFDGIDDKPVDLLFAVLVPEECTEEHLQILAKLAETFQDDELRKNLRKAKNSQDIYTLITSV